jgi:hypothetical protein
MILGVSECIAKIFPGIVVGTVAISTTPALLLSRTFSEVSVKAG